METKSAWFSKINWTQAVAFLAMLLTMFGIQLDDSTKAAILGLITSGQAIVTWVLRTWFTTKITEAAASR